MSQKLKVSIHTPIADTLVLLPSESDTVRYCYAIQLLTPIFATIYFNNKIIFCQLN